MTRKTWVLVIASVLVSIILLAGQVFAAGERKKIVMVSNSTDLRLLQLVLLGSRIKVVHTLSLINALAIELPSDRTVEQALAYLQNLLNLARVLGVSVVDVYDDLAVSVLPITPALPEEVPLTETYGWGLEHIGADVAHQEMPTVTGKGVKVAIVDTGVGDTGVVGCTHPDLPLIVDGFNALPGGGLYCDDHGHGTHMAGIIAARMNGRGIIGVAPEASIVAVKVLDAYGQGYLSDLIHGLQWIYDNQIQKDIWLVNMSLGFSTDNRPLQQAIQRLYERDTLMVASAGNSCSDDPGQDEGGGAEGEGATCDASQTGVKYPARYSGVLAVTATDSDNEITTYSVTGPQVSVTAPGGIHTGERILSTYINGTYGYGSGTSQAAAHVTGALALKMQREPRVALDQIQLLLQQTATNLRYPATQQGAGLIAVEPLLAAPEQ